MSPGRLPGLSPIRDPHTIKGTRRDGARPVRAAIASLSTGHVLMRTLITARRIAPLFIALAAVVHPAARAAEPAPAKKDSKVARPPQATLAAKVVPAEARPGDTVKLTVTASVEPGWHIYAYSKTQPDDGPSPTQFDLFDPAGLTPRGDWTAAPPPLQKKEPAFPSLPFVSYHEGDVTWSIPVVVPADAAPGKKAVRVQAGYMICSDQNCSVPGRWTLPPAEVTILPADAGAKAKSDEKVTKTGRRDGRGGHAAQDAGEEGQLRSDQAPGRRDDRERRAEAGEGRRHRHVQGHGQARAEVPYLQI